MWQLHKIFVTVQYLHTYRNLPRSFPSDAWQVTRKNPFQIGCADGIFAFKPMFSYGQRSKCADLLNSYQQFHISGTIRLSEVCPDLRQSSLF